MGYTRYWIRPRELDAEQFTPFSAACPDASKETKQLPSDEAVARCIGILKANFPEIEVPEPSQVS